MIYRPLAILAAFFVFLISSLANAEPPPISAFARLPAIRSVTISPDGKYLALISGQLGREVALVVPTDNLKTAPRPVVASDPDGFALSWCHWANNVRLLCGLRIPTEKYGYAHFETRLVAVNADGSKQQVLLQDTFARTLSSNDEILNWTPDDPDHVLIELGGGYRGYPGVFSLDVNTGGTTVVENGREPIWHYDTDPKGHARLAWGIKEGDPSMFYFVKREGESGWQQLTKIKAFTRSDELLPLAIKDGNTAYARGGRDGRIGLWEIDLADKKEPQLIFSNPDVDVSSFNLANDGHLISVRYDAERPATHFVDDDIAQLMSAVNTALPRTYNSIVSNSDDYSVLVIGAYSDVSAQSFYLFDSRKNELRPLAGAYPELSKTPLARMLPIKYRASDATIVPGYVTLPNGLKPQGLPLIVMPHGGPASRDYWGFSFLSQFLASRGYAVLQMNFRGSSGYGSKWYTDAHQDWGGLTYSDIRDATRWAIEQGLADPKRICIVGWSFGGYSALLGAVRNSDLYRCSVSIAGLSDLVKLKYDVEFFDISRSYNAEMLGADVDKLRTDSPRQHADQVQMPVLMIHGNLDAQVDVSHSKMMDTALNKYRKPHRMVIIDGADHQMSRESDRITLLTEIEKFLDANIGASQGISKADNATKPDEVLH